MVAINAYGQWIFPSVMTEHVWPDYGLSAKGGIE